MNLVNVYYYLLQNLFFLSAHLNININPSCYFMYHQFNIQQF